MSTQYLVGFAVALFALSVIAEPLAQWLRMPQTLLLVAFGAAGAFLATDVLHMDTGLRATSFHDLVFYVFLPVLVFTAAYHLPARQLTANLGIILFFAIGGMLLTAILCALLIFWGIGHSSGFPWIVALITGALLAATDPVAVVAQLKELGAPQRVATLLEGGSLFNDATAIVLFGILLGMATSGADTVSYTDAAVQFLLVFLGGAAVGAAGPGSRLSWPGVVCAAPSRWHWLWHCLPRCPTGGRFSPWRSGWCCLRCSSRRPPCHY